MLITFVKNKKWKTLHYESHHLHEMKKIELEKILKKDI